MRLEVVSPLAPAMQVEADVEDARRGKHEAEEHVAELRADVAQRTELIESLRTQLREVKDLNLSMLRSLQVHSPAAPRGWPPCMSTLTMRGA